MIDTLAETWTPPHLSESDRIVGLALVMNLPEAPALRLADQSGHPRAFRAWCRAWLSQRWDALAARAPGELAEPVSFLCLTVLPSTTGADAFELGEFSYGAYPAAPEDWRKDRLDTLLAFAVDSLA